MKSPLIWILGGVALFLLLVGITFGIMIYLEPPEEQLKVKTIDGDQKLATEIIRQKQQEIERLTTALDSLKRDYARVTASRDSILDQINFKDNLIAQYNKTVESLKAELNQKEQTLVSIKELAKTYETMKEDDLRLILAKLDDQTILQIYANVNPRNRKNILTALNAGRAAYLTQRLIKSAERQNS